MLGRVGERETEGVAQAECRECEHQRQRRVSQDVDVHRRRPPEAPGVGATRMVTRIVPRISENTAQISGELAGSSGSPRPARERTGSVHPSVHASAWQTHPLAGTAVSAEDVRPGGSSPNHLSMQLPGGAVAVHLGDCRVHGLARLDVALLQPDAALLVGERVAEDPEAASCLSGETGEEEVVGT